MFETTRLKACGSRECLEPAGGIGLVAGEVDEDERDLVAEFTGPVALAQADRNHRFELDRRLVLAFEKAPQAARGDRQHHVVDAGSKVLLDALEVAQRSSRRGEMATG